MACEWQRAFDQHFNIGCVGKTGKRANGNFKSDNELDGTWEFVFCPYCGNEIKLIETYKGKEKREWRY